MRLGAQAGLPDLSDDLSSSHSLAAPGAEGILFQMHHHGIFIVAMIYDDVVPVAPSRPILPPQARLILSQSFHYYGRVGICELRHRRVINPIAHFINCSVGGRQDFLPVSKVAFRSCLVAFAGIAFRINSYQIIGKLLPDSPANSQSSVL